VKKPRLLLLSVLGYALAVIHVMLLFMPVLPLKGMTLPLRMMQFSGFYTIAIFWDRTREFKPALHYYEHAVRSRPSIALSVKQWTDQTTLRYANALYFGGDFEGALALIRPFFTHTSAHSLSELLFMGMCLLHTKGYADLGPIMAQLENDYADDPNVRMFLFRVDLALNGFEAYEKCRRESCLPLKADPLYALTVADLLWNKGHYQPAGELYAELLEDYPSRPEFLYRNAVYSFRIAEQPEYARDLLEKLLSLDYRFPGARAEYLLLLQLGQWPADRNPGCFPEYDRYSLILFNEEWHHHLGVVLDGYQAISDGVPHAL